MAKSKINTPRPGMHYNFDMMRFGSDEQKILRKFSTEWYLTNSGANFFLGKSSYDYFLMKPTDVFSEMFNLNREVICVISPYPHFEPRTLDAFDYAQRILSDLRFETVCRVLISRDNEADVKIDSLLKTDPEQPIVIPFSYKELLLPYDNFYLRNKFRKHFYTRDLFSFLSPLKKDLYFFGRSGLIQNIVNRHRSGEHTGLFGLRKSGKTSIIYAIERHLSSHGLKFLSIDCENPSIHKLRWNELLEKLVRDYNDTMKSKYKIIGEARYSEKNAADSFAKDIIEIRKIKKKTKSILLLFDEIERISPCTGSSTHWRDGDDFIYFWQALRGFYQRNPEVFTYMLVGTNPSCVEYSTLSGHENPLFASIPSQYVPSFTLEQVEEMVSKLGSYMGLNFQETIFAKLTEDFGGHPFLIRQFCSDIHHECKGDRPVTVDKILYQKVKSRFTITAVEYLQMIIQVLKDWYTDEYEMLKFLALGDNESFLEFAKDNERYTKHLIGYGLIQHSLHGYSFNIESIREYILKAHKYEKMKLTNDEKIAEISERRNKIEMGLRTLARNNIITRYGRKKATDIVISSLIPSRKKVLENLDIEALLSRNKSQLLFSELANLIFQEWEIFKNVFEIDKERLRCILDDINIVRRSDAHAKEVEEDQFVQSRLHLKRLESILDNWGVL